MQVRVRRTAAQRRARAVAAYGAALAAVTAGAVALTVAFTAAQATATPGRHGPVPPAEVATLRWAPPPGPAGP